jgi:hypothetical protein
LRKTIKSNIRFEEKLNEEVPKGKNYIIKNVKGRDEIVLNLVLNPYQSLIILPFKSEY